MLRRLPGPSRTVALTGVVVLLLLAVTVVVAITRFRAAEHQYDRVSQQAETQRLLGALQQNLLERLQLSTSYISDGRAADLRSLRASQDRFAPLLDELERKGDISTDERAAIGEIRDANSTAIASRRAALARDTASTDQALLARSQRDVRRLRTLVRSFSDDEAAEVPAVIEEARADASQARKATAGIAILVALIIVALLAYVVRVLARLFDRVGRTARALSGATLEMRTATQQSAAATSEQSAAIAELAATVDELSATAASIAAGAQTSASAADQTVQTMEEMRAQVSAIAERSLELGKASQEIGEILDLLNEIAERTDLLALNAAIEAARAGEAGRGFAVVAGEVRKLAERSSRSTESIKRIVARVQDGTNATILATEDGTKKADLIADLMHSSIPELDESLHATEQQRDAAEQVAAALAEIRGAVEQLSAEQGARIETTARVEQLAADLDRLLERNGVVPDPEHRS
ncbi:methyl-accepting chemotaxis protein [Patulibacter sp. S7RM1-6]